MGFSLRFRPPPPPPPNPVPPFPLLTVAFYVGWVIFLLCAQRRMTMLNPHRLDGLWLCWPVALGVFTLTQYDLQATAIGQGRNLSDPKHSMAFALPIAAFGLLLISEAVTWLFSFLGPRPKFANVRHPVMSVHAVSLLYYIYEPGPESCTMRDAFGRPLHPLRYVMWTISVSAMCLSLYLVAENMLLWSRVRNVSFARMRDWLVDAELACCCTFVLGFLGSSVQLADTKLPNYVFFCASSVAFYIMLNRISSMLKAVMCNSIIIEKQMASQFAAIRMAVIFVWHIFPSIWLLGASNQISVFAEHLGYIISDLCAKYLLLFVYIASVNA